ncbi:MAG: PTS transporter subunit EIIB [Brevinema sp.]
MDISDHIINLVGGGSNIAELDNCLTRVRIIVHNPSLISQKEASKLEALNMTPVINGKNVHIIVGTKSSEYKKNIEQALKTPSTLTGVEGLIIKLCGGLQNISELDNCLTRVRIIVHNPDLIVKKVGAEIEKSNYVPVINGKNIHIIVGIKAEEYRKHLEALIS